MKLQPSQNNVTVWKRCGGDAVYGIGVVGALIYFLQHAPTFTDKLLAIVKAFVWPSLIVYRLLEYFRMS